MYKTKVDIPIKSGLIFAGATLERDGGNYVARHVFNKTIVAEWCADVVESHPEFFEKVEEKSLAEKFIDERFGTKIDTCFIHGYPLVALLQSYHNLAGGWSDDDMVDFWRHTIHALPYHPCEHFNIKQTAREDDAKQALALYKQQRGRK